MDGWFDKQELSDPASLFFLPRQGVHLSESDLRAVSDGLSVAAAGGSWDAALYFARTATDCHPQV